jgi:hypothetical protein
MTIKDIFSNFLHKAMWNNITIWKMIQMVVAFCLCCQSKARNWSTIITLFLLYQENIFSYHGIMSFITYSCPFCWSVITLLENNMNLLKYLSSLKHHNNNCTLLRTLKRNIWAFARTATHDWHFKKRKPKKRFICQTSFRLQSKVHGF